MKIFYLLCVFLLSFNELFANNACRFEHPIYGVINLSSIGSTTGQPTFKDVQTTRSSNYVYSFNPCYSFTEWGCQNAAVCQIASDRSFTYKLGQQNSSSWSFDTSTSTSVLRYTYGNKIVSISMICSAGPTHRLEVDGETSLNYYPMRLRSPCACWNGCEQSTTSSTTQKTSTTPSTYSDACSYHDSQRGTIDLSSIAKVDGTAAFTDVSTGSGDDFLWSYNPCVPFIEDSCYRVAGCQKSKTLSTSWSIGLQERAQWINMNSTGYLLPSIVYSTSTNQRQLTVQLICDTAASDHQLRVIGEISTGRYLMTLKSRCACWNGCYSEPTPKPRHHFKWRTWMTIVSAAGGIFVCLCCIVTCLMCSKPKRKHQRVFIDERTPIIRRGVNFDSFSKK